MSPTDNAAESIAVDTLAPYFMQIRYIAPKLLKTATMEIAAFRRARPGLRMGSNPWHVFGHTPLECAELYARRIIRRMESPHEPFIAVDHVQLAMPAGREDQARLFYAEVLGMIELPKPDELAKRGGCWFASGPVQIHLGVEAEFRPARKAHPGLRCNDLDALLARLREADIAYEENRATGSLRAFVHDPFGNRIELLSS